MKKLNIDLYKSLFLIRSVEEKIRQIYPRNEIKMPTHLAIGEEAIATGVCRALSSADQIFGSYRNHGIYLAKTGETDDFFAELFGKKSGLSKGKAGSMHVMSPEHNVLGTSAIVASMIPVAVGAAFANQYKKNNRLVAVFFGDGAVDEGAFWESINFACLKKLPIIFVCEDNGYAIHSHVSERHSYQSITQVISRFNCHVFESESTDAEIIYKLTKKAIKLLSASPKPVFMHLKYYRYLEHVGINQDFNFGYRPKKEYEKWLKIDPVNLQRKKLVKAGCDEKIIQTIENNIIKKIENSVRWARKELLPAIDELYTDVYYE